MATRATRNPELRRPFMQPSGLETERREAVIDDVTQIVQRVPFLEVAPARLFDPGLISELADASDRLAVKVAKLQEGQGASR